MDHMQRQVRARLNIRIGSDEIISSSTDNYATTGLSIHSTNGLVTEYHHMQFNNRCREFKSCGDAAET